MRIAIKGLLGLALLLAGSPHARAVVYDCTVEHVVASMQRDSSQSGALLSMYPRFLFDAESGFFRWMFAHRQDDARRFELLADGSPQGSDLVALRRLPGPFGGQTTLLRIRSWERPSRFVVVDHLGDVFIGQCRW